MYICFKEYRFKKTHKFQTQTNLRLWFCYSPVKGPWMSYSTQKICFFNEWNSCSVAKSCPTLCNPMDYRTPGSSVLTISNSLLKLMSIESVILSNHLILCHPFLLLPSIFPSIRVFSNELALCISPSNEYPGLISFRIDWFHFPAVQETLKSLLQHHNSKASILWYSAFFMV